MAANSQSFVPKSGQTSSGATASVLPALPRKSLAGSRSVSQARNGPESTIPTDITSERATTALIRRVLCAQLHTYGSEQRERGTPRPLEEMLPPLTSSNEVDLQLYALIAIIMKEFVYAWYSKITPDHSFAEEVIRVVAHCTRALEQRLRHVDIHALVLDEIPSLVEAHIIAYRMASRSAVAAHSQTQFRMAYHALNPHPALPVPDSSTPATVAEQQERETIYCQMLAQGILATLLPTEDLENVCLRTLVGDILANLFLGEIIGGKVAEGWFIWEVITKLARGMTSGANEDTEMVHRETGRLESFGLLSPQMDTGASTDTSKLKSQSSLFLLVWKFLQYAYLTYAAIRFVTLELAQVVTTSSFMPVREFVSATVSKYPATETQSWPSTSTERLPIIKYRIFGMASQLVDISERMPWLGGYLALAQHVLLKGPGKVGETDGFVDKLLHHAFQRHLFTRTLLPALLLATRTTVFPLNARPVSLEVSSNTNIGIAAGSKQKEAESLPLTTAPPPPQSTSRRQPQQAGLSSDQRSNGAKINSIKRACARSILQLIPKRVALAVFAIPTDKEFCDATNLSADNSNSNPAPLVLPLSARAATTPPISVSQSFNTTPSLSDAAGSENRSEGNIDSDPIQSNLGLCSTRTSTQTTGIVGNKTAKLNLSTSHHEQGEGRDEEEQLLCAIEHEVLDLFSDSYCNKHLVYSIVEAVLAKLIPELTEQGIGELMAERGL